VGLTVDDNGDVDTEEKNEWTMSKNVVAVSKFKLVTGLDDGRTAISPSVRRVTYFEL
jgi:hypothetical protein